MASNRPEEEPEEGFYILEGKRYTISEGEQAHESMIKALDEVMIEGTDERTLIAKIVERVQVIMATHYGTIMRESKLRERAIQL